jgi:hypothetical protein
MKFLQEAD